MAFSIPEAALVPEGIAYDPIGDAFYIGSTNLRKIVQVNAAGAVRNFVPTADNGLWGVLGLNIDAERRVLWAASSHAGAGMPIQDMEAGEEGSSGIFKYDLETGQLLKKYLLSNEGEAHFLNDLAVTPDGSVYATDSGALGIYRIDAEIDSLELFLADPDLPWPNGITWSEEAGALFVALDGRIGRVTTDSATLSYVDLPVGTSAFADGIYFFDQSLITVWPFETGSGVTRYHMDASLSEITEVESILSSHPTFAQPTTGAIKGDAIYVIANSQLQLFRALESGEIAGGRERLADPIILRVPLAGPGKK